ncbi:hypothetical protein VNO77_21082 [Canavalia gladiata]|uniref:Secreted protein n=1 Tax=Canavalia gladiata TaxID=3824 RepID=A0AAN9LQF1_CANGL
MYFICSIAYLGCLSLVAISESQMEWVSFSIEIIYSTAFIHAPLIQGAPQTTGNDVVGSFYIRTKTSRNVAHYLYLHLKLKKYIAVRAKGQSYKPDTLF